MIELEGSDIKPDNVNKQSESTREEAEKDSEQEDRYSYP